MLVVICLVHIIGLTEATTSLGGPGYGDTFDQIPVETMILPGDIYMGAISPISDYNPHGLCSNIVLPSLIQIPTMVAYGIKLVNENKYILPNITLGMVCVDSCLQPLASMGQALKFVPTQTNLSQPYFKIPPVIGMIGPLRSPAMAYVAGIFNIFQIPMISPASTADELSDRSRYGNFFRLVAPDSYQTKAIVDVLKYFNWTYFSVIYEENTYGFNCLINIKKYVKSTDICMANTYGINAQAVHADYDFVVSKMLKDKNAKVIVVFLPSLQVKQFYKAVEDHHAESLFTYFFADGTLPNNLQSHGRFISGALFVRFYTTEYPGYQKYIGSLSPRTVPENPWLLNIWEDYFNCLLPDIYNLKHECSNKTLTDIPGFSIYTIPATLAPIIYAQAIDALIKEECPDGFSDKTRLLDCVKPALLIHYLKETVYTTNMGSAQFDETGALIPGYLFLQARVDNETRVVTFHEVGNWRKDILEVHTTKMWKTGDGNSVDLPISICALPCEAGEFLVQGELACCWDCFKCRDNEYVSDNGTSCSSCPYAHWPDQETFLGCVAIEPSFLWWTDKYGIGLTVLAGLGVFIAIVLVVIMRTNHDKKVIKGSSINMMLVINLGLLMMFINVFLFIARPSFYLCLASRFGFNFSCILVFAPMLIKTNRLYQIFKASSKFAEIHPTANPNVSAVLTGILLSIAMIIIAVCIYLWPVDAKITMPVLTTQYVELSCEQDMIGLVIPLCYNILILLICSIFAFLTRALPDNFNESWYILLSVSATLFVWMAFLPTYFSAFYASHKVALLGLALVLNGLITVVCFFATKFYALFFIDERDIKITNFDTQTFELESSKAETTS